MINKVASLKAYKNSKTRNEEGFTLIEIMVVVLIIAVLIGITVPVFSFQQAASMEATLKTDLRNAGLVMRTEATKNSGRMLSYLPSFSTQSADNQVNLDSSRSNEYYYCLVGTNVKLADTLYYSSYTGKITKTICPTLVSAQDGAGGTGGSGSGGTGETGSGSGTTTPGTIINSGADFDTALQDKLSTGKAAIIRSGNINIINATNVANTVSGYGFSGVDIATTGEFSSWSDEKTNSYDMLVFFNNAWSSGEGLKTKINDYYLQGGLVFHEGNDTGKTISSLITENRNIGNRGATYDPTFNQGLKPTFPYTFEATGFGSDSSWACITGIAEGAVSVAETKFADATCITMFAATNDKGGRYVYATSLANGFSQPIKASFQWLLS